MTLIPTVDIMAHFTVKTQFLVLGDYAPIVSIQTLIPPKYCTLNFFIVHMALLYKNLQGAHTCMQTPVLVLGGPSISVK